MSPLFSQNTHVHSGLTHVRTFHKPVLMWTVLIQNAVPSGIIRSHVTQILPSMPCRHCQLAHTRDEGQLPFWPCPFLITKFLRKFHFHLVFCGIWPLRCCWRVTPFAECAESPAAQLLCVIFRVTQITPLFMQNLCQFATLKYPHLLGESCSSHCKPFTGFECAFNHIFCHLWVIGSH